MDSRVIRPLRGGCLLLAAGSAVSLTLPDLPNALTRDGLLPRSEHTLGDTHLWQDVLMHPGGKDPSLAGRDMQQIHTVLKGVDFRNAPQLRHCQRVDVTFGIAHLKPERGGGGAASVETGGREILKRTGGRATGCKTHPRVFNRITERDRSLGPAGPARLLGQAQGNKTNKQFSKSQSTLLRESYSSTRRHYAFFSMSPQTHISPSIVSFQVHVLYNNTRLKGEAQIRNNSGRSREE